MINPIKKAALKTAFVFIGAFIVLQGVIIALDLREAIAFFHEQVVFQNKDWQFFSALFVGVFGVLMGYLGYKIAMKKKRNAKNWAVLCFLFNIWGIVFLSFLPPVDHTEDYLFKEHKDQETVSNSEM
jgi:hypothetical protein